MPHPVRVLLALRIKNLALVSELALELQPGYNVITGETGAGKSILIGALNLVLGERANRTLIRSGSDSCSVEALFDIRKVKSVLAPLLERSGLEPCEENQLVLKRTFTEAGMNRQFVNGSPATLNVLSEIGEWLVDIHGPHEHQSLLHSAKQIDLLDAFAKLEEERETFAQLLEARERLEAEKRALIVDERTYAQQLDLLRHQVNEIGSACLKPEDETELEENYRRASNAAKLLDLTQAARDLLSESDGSVLNQATNLGKTLQELRRVDASAVSLLTLHEQAIALIQELQTEVSRYSERVDVDPAQLKQLEERLDLIHSLKRKYGGSVAEIIAFGDEARRKLQGLEQGESELVRLDGEISKVEAELWKAGQALSKQRRKVIPQLNRAVCEQLADLGFKQSHFDISISTLGQAGPGLVGAQGLRLTRSGLDSVEFQFAPNPGEPSRPLRAIASSGEMARVMLALKTVLATADQIPVLVFDEVDANIGGETANAVGDKMRRIAEKRQVLCITHLPQVAAPATAHYVATKQTRGGRTTSEITLLNEQERVTELARMLGGQSEVTRKHAEALLK